MQSDMQRKAKVGAENGANVSDIQEKAKAGAENNAIRATCKEKQSGHAKRCKCKWYAKKTNADMQNNANAGNMQTKPMQARKTRQMQAICK